MAELNENLIADLVERELVSDTFRRLQPEKKLLIFREAVRLFGRYGYDGLSIERICRECAISKGSLFQYFPSKIHLLEFTLLIFDDYLGRWVQEVRERETAVHARDRLRHLYHEIIANSKLHRPEQMFYLFATRGLHHAGVTLEGIDLERHFREYIAEIIERGEATGEIRGDFDINLTAYLVSVIIDGIVARKFLEPGTVGPHIGDYLISFLFDGVKN